jgi:hypothetical protein
LPDVGPPVGDAALERGLHLGEAQVQLVVAQLGLGRRQGRLRPQQLGVALVERGLGRGRGAHQPLGAILLELRQLELGLRLPDLRLVPVDRRLVGPGIDHEQDLVLLDHLAVVEPDLLEIARDAGANLDLLHRLEASGELVPLGELAHQRRGHRDLGRRRGDSPGPAGTLGFALPAGGEQQRGAHQGRCREGPRSATDGSPPKPRATTALDRHRRAGRRPTIRFQHR